MGLTRRIARNAAPRRTHGTALAVALIAALAALGVVGHTVIAGGGKGRTFNDVVGTPKRDVLFGTVRADRIVGRGGADKIAGRGGADVIFGGGGADKIRGGKGADRLMSGRGGATMIGGKGRDEFNMKGGRQIGGGGRDVIRARDGSPDEINCGPGHRDVAYVDPVEDGIYDCERVRVGHGGKR